LGLFVCLIVVVIKGSQKPEVRSQNGYSILASGSWLLASNWRTSEWMRA
jgi:hypothetical protein